MKELETIQEKEKLNKVWRVDEKGIGGAAHHFAVSKNDGECVLAVKFQKGPRKAEDSEHGVIDSDLLEIVRDRLKSFQDGSFASEEGQFALIAVEEALFWLNRRVEDRIKRNVLGKNVK